MGNPCWDLSFPPPFLYESFHAFWCGKQRESYFQAKPKIQHWDSTKGLGRYMLWACPWFSIGYFTPLWETFSVSSLASNYIFNSKHSRLCLPSSPSSSGRLVIISTSSHSFSSRQGQSNVVCFLRVGPSPCCPPAQTCTCGMELLGLTKAQLMSCRLLNIMAVNVPGCRSVLWAYLVSYFWHSPSSCPHKHLNSFLIWVLLLPARAGGLMLFLITSGRKFLPNHWW